MLFVAFTYLPVAPSFSSSASEWLIVSRPIPFFHFLLRHSLIKKVSFALKYDGEGKLAKSQWPFGLTKPVTGFGDF